MDDGAALPDIRVSRGDPPRFLRPLQRVRPSVFRAPRPQHSFPLALSLFATAAFAFNGLLIHLATSIQPESLLVLLLVLALTAIARWVENDSPGALLLRACLVIAAAILVKSSAALLGFVIAYFVYRKHGFGAVRVPSVLAGFLIAVLPPLLWYGWAHQHYLDTGLSLGLSNETHFLNLEVLRQPFSVIKGNLVTEVAGRVRVRRYPLGSLRFSAEVEKGRTGGGVLRGRCVVLRSWRRTPRGIVGRSTTTVCPCLRRACSWDGDSRHSSR